MDCVVPLYRRCMEMGLGDKDVAAMVDVIGALPRQALKAKGDTA